MCVVILAGMTGMALGGGPALQGLLPGHRASTARSRRADKAPTQVLAKTVTVRFDANVRDMPWTFSPSQVSQTVKLGAQNVAFYKVTNTSDHAITGQAAYNVVPEVAAQHFQKLQCFCFSEQTIEPGQTVEFPVVYFVAPEYATDPETRRIPEITLSYTFFRVKDEPGKRAAAKSPSPGLGEPPRAGL